MEAQAHAHEQPVCHCAMRKSFMLIPFNRCFILAMTMYRKWRVCSRVHPSLVAGNYRQANNSFHQLHSPLRSWWMGTKKLPSILSWKLHLWVLSCILQTTEKEKNKKAASSPDQRDGHFHLSFEVGKLMVSSSKLWPRAVDPIIHGGSPLPHLLSGCVGLSVRVSVCGRPRIH